MVSKDEDPVEYDLRKADDKDELWVQMNNLVIQPAIQLNYKKQAERFGSQVSVSGSSLKSSKKEERKDEPEAPEPETIAYKWYQKYQDEGFAVKDIFDDLYTFFPNIPMNKDFIKGIIDQCFNRLTPDETMALYYANVDDKQTYDLETGDDMEAFVNNLNEFVIKPAVDLNDTAHAMRLATWKQYKQQQVVSKFQQPIALKRSVIEKLKANVEKKKIERIGKKIVISRLVGKRKARKATTKAQAEAQAKVKAEEAKADEPPKVQAKADEPKKEQAKAEEPKKEQAKADEALMKQRLIATLGILGSDKGQLKQDLITMFRQAENPKQALTFYFDNLAARRVEKKPLDDSVKRMLRKTLVNMNKLSENGYSRTLQVPKDVNDKSLSYANFPATLQTARDEAATLLDAEIKAAQPQSGPGRKRKSRKRPSKKSVKKMSAKVNKEIFRLLRS
jgi:hypothetical protein